LAQLKVRRKFTLFQLPLFVSCLVDGCCVVW
jgi:hypothetical protein